MNSKGEFNRCKLPRLSVMMGRKEILEEVGTEEQMTELEVESEIGKWRNKKRDRDKKVKESETSAKEPPRKRRKKFRIEKCSKKRKPEEEEAIENFNKRIRFDANEDNQNKCNEIFHLISIFESSQNRPFPTNLQLSEKNEPKKLFPMFTVGRGKSSEGENSKNKANQTLSSSHHHHQHKSETNFNLKTSSKKKGKLKLPEFNYKPITSHFKPNPKITAGHTQN